MRRILILLAMLTAACSRGPIRRAPIDKVQVVATVYPLAAVAQAVGGPVVDAQWLVESGQSLSGLGDESRPRLGAARLVLFNSGITEPWIAADAGMTLGGERLLRLDQLPEAQKLSPTGWLWLDPLIVRSAAVELHNRLLALRAGQASILSDRTDAFTADLDAMMKEYAPKFAPLAGRQVLVLGHAFDPLVQRVNLVADDLLDKPPADLDDEDLDYLRSQAKDPSAALLIDADTPAATRNRIAAGGLKVIAIDALGSSASAGRNTYLALMRFNYEALLDGLR